MYPIFKTDFFYRVFFSQLNLLCLRQFNMKKNIKNPVKFEIINSN